MHARSVLPATVGHHQTDGMARTDGVPCWAELDVEDAGTVTPFYTAVLGWAVGPGTAAEHQAAVARVDGRPVAAFGSPGVAAPPVWTLDLAVDDVDAAAGELEELGGQVLHGPEDDGAGGRLLVGVDAGAAVVGLWESDDEIPSGGARAAVLGRGRVGRAGDHAHLLP